MKNIVSKLIFTTFFSLMLFSCQEDYLEVEHYNIVSPEALAEADPTKTMTQLVNGLYDTFYGMESSGTKRDWHFKPHVQLGNMPAMDCQAGGWDANWSKFGWLADDGFFLGPWKHCYTAINRVNVFLQMLENVDVAEVDGGQDYLDLLEAEARVIRAYNFFYLTINFGPVPMLETGETYSNTPDKPRPESTEAAWKKIIEDFTFAEEIIDWAPRNNEAGRITKGMVKAYLAKSYMQNNQFEMAKLQLEDIVQEGIYELEPCFGAMNAVSYRYGKESVWEVAYPEHENMNWSGANDDDAYWWVNNNMEWGSLFISHEWVEDMEVGDYRKDYSVMTYGNGNPYFELPENHPTFTSGMYVNGEVNLANNRCLKYWQECNMITKEDPQMIHYRKSALLMRYAEVLLNLAECKFQTGGNGWSEINQIRNRAFANLEVGLNSFPNGYDAEAIIPSPRETGMPVIVPDAQIFYTNYKNTKGYSSEVWKVALVQERRKEFVAEYTVWYDLTRMGMAEEFLDIEYPLNGRYSKRSAEYDEHFDIFPIPNEEILTNDGISPADQNPGY
ncbi:RagB/SusD family nutrient uptake outer membrane protein [Labilibacter sediminis]|nr:RagB/SusD family nutrient uptake outer membrane protein [Labilibacter sediminis]